MSRTENSIKNFISGSFGMMLTMILKFVTRSVFVATLGKQYLGVSALFTNVISVLSLAELGVGNAIVFNLYKPIAQKDEKQICRLMNLYRNVYRLIGLVIMIIGICLIPFLPIIIKDDISYFNAPLIFILYLLQSVSTYLFFAYKKALIIANQKEYKITVINYGFIVASNFTEIAVLYFTKSFELYVACLIFFNIFQNIFVSKIADKMFPFIKHKVRETLPKNEKKEIFKNCYAIFIYKINSVVLNATDNIIISTFIGLEIVGLYSNYLMIYTSMRSIINVFYNAMTASLGNLHASGDSNHEYFIFKYINFITAWIFGIASVGFFVVANKFICVWLGEDFLLPMSFIFLMSIEFFLYGFLKVLATFRTSMGLFQQSKYRPFFGVVINLIVSLVMVKYVGIYGVVIGTLVANLLTYIWYDPLIIYKYGFMKNSLEYFIGLLKYFITILCAGALALFICYKIPFLGWWSVVICAIICVLIVSAFMVLLYGRTKEARYMSDMLRMLRKKVFNYRKKNI